jgi:hypothetical protein
VRAHGRGAGGAGHRRRGRGGGGPIGRDFTEITCSILLRRDGGSYDELLATLAEWRDAGAALATLGGPAHFAPESLSALAAALATFA